MKTHTAELSCELDDHSKRRLDEAWLEHNPLSDAAARRIRFEVNRNLLKVIRLKPGPTDWDETSLKQACQMVLHRALGDEIKILRWLDQA